MSEPSLRTKVLNVLLGFFQWENVTRLGMVVPLRKRGDGKCGDRDPSDKDTQDFLATDAW